MFANRALRKIFCLKRDKVTGESKRLRSEQLVELYSSSSIIRVAKSRKMTWAGRVARMGRRGGAYRVLVGETEGKRPLGRPRRGWEDNTKTG